MAGRRTPGDNPGAEALAAHVERELEKLRARLAEVEADNAAWREHVDAVAKIGRLQRELEKAVAHREVQREIEHLKKRLVEVERERDEAKARAEQAEARVADLERERRGLRANLRDMERREVLAATEARRTGWLEGARMLDDEWRRQTGIKSESREAVLDGLERICPYRPGDAGDRLTRLTTRAEQAEAHVKLLREALTAYDKARYGGRDGVLSGERSDIAFSRCIRALDATALPTTTQKEDT
jgi:chromosome segregation ATPase